MWQSPNWMWFTRAARGQKQGAVSPPLSFLQARFPQGASTWKTLYLTLMQPYPPRMVILETPGVPWQHAFSPTGASIYHPSIYPPILALTSNCTKENITTPSTPFVCWNSIIKAWNCHTDCRSPHWIWITNKWWVIFSISNVWGKIWGHKHTKSYTWFTENSSLISKIQI